RMGENRLPQRLYESSKSGRLRKSWNVEISEAMQKRQLQAETYRDKRAWRSGCGRRSSEL
ncbi:hypothetical protein ILUMI_15445, partial [Ignelater luminosus]